MLCAAKTDTLGPEFTGHIRIMGCIGICPDLQGADLISPFHELSKIT